MDKLASPWSITRQNAQRDLEALRAILDNDGMVESDVVVLEEIADAIKAQLPEPPVREPSEFGSVVRAFVCGSNAELWVRVRVGVLSEWANEHGSHVDWHRLCEPEVLRVGVGKADKPAEGFCTCYPNEKALDCGVSEHRREARIYRDPMDDAPEAERADVAPEETEDYKAGVTDTAYDLHRKLIDLRSEAITSERKSAYDTAINLVAPLLGES